MRSNAVTGRAPASAPSNNAASSDQFQPRRVGRRVPADVAAGVEQDDDPAVPFGPPGADPPCLLAAGRCPPVESSARRRRRRKSRERVELGGPGRGREPATRTVELSQSATTSPAGKRRLAKRRPARAPTRVRAWLPCRPAGEAERARPIGSSPRALRRSPRRVGRKRRLKPSALTRRPRRSAGSRGVDPALGGQGVRAAVRAKCRGPGFANEQVHDGEFRLAGLLFAPDREQVQTAYAARKRQDRRRCRRRQDLPRRGRSPTGQPWQPRALRRARRGAVRAVSATGNPGRQRGEPALRRARHPARRRRVTPSSSASGPQCHPVSQRRPGERFLRRPGVT